MVDHYRPPCTNGFRPQWCYLVATAEKPNEYPYFYGEIEGFNFHWGHQYQLLVLREAAPRSAASLYNYRLVKILSDKKNSPIPRVIESDQKGLIISIAEVGGLHHRYQRVA
jgi:hypothetical protein